MLKVLPVLKDTQPYFMLLTTKPNSLKLLKCFQLISEVSTGVTEESTGVSGSEPLPELLVTFHPGTTNTKLSVVTRSLPFNHTLRKSEEKELSSPDPWTPTFQAMPFMHLSAPMMSPLYIWPLHMEILTLG